MVRQGSGDNLAGVIGANKTRVAWASCPRTGFARRAHERSQAFQRLDSGASLSCLPPGGRTRFDGRASFALPGGRKGMEETGRWSPFPGARSPSARPCRPPARPCSSPAWLDNPPRPSRIIPRIRRSGPRSGPLRVPAGPIARPCPPTARRVCLWFPPTSR
jgi:hypothetical protein